MDWTGDRWQYVIVILILMYALWRMVRGLRKVKKNPGSCSGCSLAGQCKDYSVDKKRYKNNISDSSSGEANCCSQTEDNLPGSNKRSCHK